MNQSTWLDEPEPWDEPLSSGPAVHEGPPTELDRVIVQHGHPVEQDADAAPSRVRPVYHPVAPSDTMPCSASPPSGQPVVCIPVVDPLPWFPEDER